MPNMATISPCFAVADVGATIRWYEDQLGFQSDPFPEREPFVFAILTRDGIEIMLQRVNGYQKPDLYASRDGGVWNAYIRMEGVTEFYESVREKVEIVQPLRQQPYGMWEFEVKDLNGYILVFAE
jgi:uncharacterized glyoxalase superfamily protein PhnB